MNDNIIRYTPVDHNNIPIADNWLISIDTLNNRAQWRDHWKVENISDELKSDIEERVLKQWPKIKWLKQYTADGTNVWATCRAAACEILDRMNIKVKTTELESI